MTADKYLSFSADDKPLFVNLVLDFAYKKTHIWFSQCKTRYWSFKHYVDLQTDKATKTKNKNKFNSF